MLIRVALRLGRSNLIVIGAFGLGRQDIAETEVQPATVIPITQSHRAVLDVTPDLDQVTLIGRTPLALAEIREGGRVGQVSNYPPELRKQTVPLVLEGNRSTREMARELGINQKTLRN